MRCVEEGNRGATAVWRMPRACLIKLAGYQVLSRIRRSSESAANETTCGLPASAPAGNERERPRRQWDQNNRTKGTEHKVLIPERFGRGFPLPGKPCEKSRLCRSQGRGNKASNRRPADSDT